MTSSANILKMRTSLGERNDTRTAYAMVLPTVVLFLMFCIYPIAHVLFLSFFESDGMTTMKWIGGYNYARVLKDASWWKTVFNTVEFGILAPVIQIPLSLILAVILNGRLRCKNLFRTVLFLPSITSTAIMGIIFSFMFASYNGIINGMLKNLGIVSKHIDWLGQEGTAKAVIILFGAWSHVGYYMVLFLAGLQKIPGDVYESAAVDGAGSFQTFTRITVPMLGSSLRTIIMLSILNTMKMFDTVKVITNGGPAQATEVMTMYIYRYYFEPDRGKLQQGYASALAIVGLIITAIVAVIYLYVSKKASKDEEMGLLS